MDFRPAMHGTGCSYSGLRGRYKILLKLSTFHFLNGVRVAIELMINSSNYREEGGMAGCFVGNEDNWKTVIVCWHDKKDGGKDIEPRDSP